VIEITETGTTLRENRLKLLDDGRILRSQACLIGNRRALAASEEKRQTLRGMMELIEAHLRARHFRTVTANIRGDSPEDVARHVVAQVETAGAQGPTIARVYPKQGALSERWFAVTVLVHKQVLQKAIDHLRRAGASGISVHRPEYLFEAESWAYRAAMHALERDA
jgi:ATP phosphoribosyltransferase